VKPEADIAAHRLWRQYITRPYRGTAASLVQYMGAVQGQEYPFAKWALGLRLGGVADAEGIEQALQRGEILRTHVMRPTWHFVAASDIRWLLELTGPRVQAGMRTYFASDGLDARRLNRATAVIEKALAGGRSLTRAELGVQLTRARIQLTVRQLYFVTINAELEGVICSGPRRGKQFTYALLAERAAPARGLTRDEALAELARRFFTSHAPATIRDFVWWSGLRTADARRGLDMIGARAFEQERLTYWSHGSARPPALDVPVVRLLPIYDEYIVAYRDRVAVPHGPGKVKQGAELVTFWHALVVNGHVAGTWRLERRPGGLIARVTAVRRLKRIERDALEPVRARYERFLGEPLALSVA
jgi:hypothetical protein